MAGELVGFASRNGRKLQRMDAQIAGDAVGDEQQCPLVQALRYGKQDTLNQVGKQIITLELGVAPTLTIRPGYPVTVIITRDLVIEPQADRP